jgi:hypothetical protein
MCILRSHKLIANNINYNHFIFWSDLGDVMSISGGPDTVRTSGRFELQYEYPDYIYKEVTIGVDTPQYILEGNYIVLYQPSEEDIIAFLKINSERTVVIDTVAVSVPTIPSEYTYNEPTYDYGFSIIVILINTNDAMYSQNFITFDCVGYTSSELFVVQKVFYKNKNYLSITNLHTISDILIPGREATLNSMTTSTVPTWAQPIYSGTKLKSQYNFAELELHKPSWILEASSGYESVQLFDITADLEPTLFMINYGYKYVTVTNDRKSNPDVTNNLAYARF